MGDGKDIPWNPCTHPCRGSLQGRPCHGRGHFPCRPLRQWLASLFIELSSQGDSVGSISNVSSETTRSIARTWRQKVGADGDRFLVE